MNDTISMRLDREAAATWASWFAALGDPTRILIIQLLATSTDALTVGEITTAVDVGQSTVSHHLAKLADVGFVLVRREGTASYWRVNQRCVSAFPTAAQAVLGGVPSEFSQALEKPT